ncbi:MAG: TlpA family protein disulfide reductase [Candidatus Limnocylindrales bacterium]
MTWTRGSPLTRLGLTVAGLLVCAGAAGLLAIGLQRAAPAGPQDRIGDDAPAFSLEQIEGGHTSLADQRGRGVVLNFWASWCQPCREETGLLEGVVRSDDGSVVLGVVYDDSPAAAAAFMKQYGLDYPALLDPGSRTALDYGIVGIPETVFIDRAGVIRARSIGPLSPATLAADLLTIGP